MGDQKLGRKDHKQLDTMKTAIYLLLLAIVGHGWCCLTDTDCSMTQCCLRQDIMIASKRQLNLPFGHGGRCIARQQVGEECSSFNACGCAQGLQCHYTDEALTGKRRIAFRAGTCQVDPDV